MIYHGSTISGLKEIVPKESTQKGKYVYGTPNLIYAAIFSIIQRTDKPFPPKLGGFQSQLYLAERFENQFQSIQNISASIYILDENNFHSFDNHSAGNEIEKRAEGTQKVQKEIKIDNVLDYLIKNNVKLYKYEEREKIGIPTSDKYLVQGVLQTYLWKIEGRTEEDYTRGKKHIEYCKKNLPKYSEIIDDFVKMINQLPEEEAIYFVDNLYDKNTDTFSTKSLETMKENSIKPNIK